MTKKSPDVPVRDAASFDIEFCSHGHIHLTLYDEEGNAFATAQGDMAAVRNLQKTVGDVLRTLDADADDGGLAGMETKGRA